MPESTNSPILEALHAVGSVVRFELNRVFSPSRIITWMMLVLFPLLLILAARRISRNELPFEVASIAIYLLVPQIMCVLALLLWATPIVQSEIEGQTWIYVALRPWGRLAMVIGKYVVAVLFAASAGCVASSLCSIASGTSDWFLLMRVMCCLSILSSLAYAAAYTLMGVLFFRRPMVFAVAFTVGVELLLSIIPATVNKLTISYRLRALLADWLPLQFPDDLMSLFITAESNTAHILQLVVYTAIVLTIAIIIASRREYPVGGDT